MTGVGLLSTCIWERQVTRPIACGMREHKKYSNMRDRPLFGDAPSMTKSMHMALHDLKLERLFVVHPGKDSYVMNDQMEAVAITHLRARLSQAGVGGAR